MRLAVRRLAFYLRMRTQLPSRYGSNDCFRARVGQTRPCGRVFATTMPSGRERRPACVRAVRRKAAKQNERETFQQ